MSYDDDEEQRQQYLVLAVGKLYNQSSPRPSLELVSRQATERLLFEVSFISKNMAKNMVQTVMDYYKKKADR